MSERTPNSAPNAAAAADSSLPPELGTVVTFYSYKGGVGRSMALANVAALLAREGKRVLVIDWDLEAPGIDKYLHEAESRGSSIGSAFGVAHDARSHKSGLIDLIVAWQRLTQEGADSSAIAQKYYKQLQLPSELDWRECLLECRPFADGEILKVLSAGRDGPDYIKYVQGLDWNALFTRNQVGLYLERLRDEWRREFDFVLIDSRTGLSDSGSICTSLLPDQLVVLFTANEQSLQGVLTAVRGARAAQSALAVARSGLPVVPIPARDEPYNEKALSDQWRARYASEFAEFYEEWAVGPPAGNEPNALGEPIPSATILNRLFIPYASYWSFGDRLPVLEDAERENPAKLGAAYVRLAQLIGSGLDWSSTEAVRSPLDIDRARAQAARAQLEAVAKQTELQKSIDRYTVLQQTLDTRKSEQTVTVASRSSPVRWVLLGLAVLLFGVPLWLWIGSSRSEQQIQLNITTINNATDPDAAASLAALRKLLPADDPRLLSATRKVGDLYSAAGQHDKALESYNELLKQKNDAHERASLQLAIAHELAATNKFEQAVKLLEDGRKEADGASHVEESEAFDEALAKLYEALPNPRVADARKAWETLIQSRRARLPRTSDLFIQTRTNYARFQARNHDTDGAMKTIQEILVDTNQGKLAADPSELDLRSAARFPALKDTLRAYEAVLRLTPGGEKKADALKYQIQSLEGLSSTEQQRPSMAK